MKKILILLPILLIVSCWSKTSDGREYKIDCNCLTGHYQTSIIPITTIVNNQPIVTTQIQNTWVCDERICDTVWRKK